MSRVAAHRKDLEDGLTYLMDSHVDHRMEQYEKVSVQFKKFFNQDELENRFDRKADVDFVRRVNGEKASRSELLSLREMIKGYDKKLKTISVFASELANSMLPERLSRKFEKENDLFTSIKKREEIIEQGKLIANWILKTSNEDLQGETTEQMTVKDLKKDKNSSVEILTFSSKNMTSNIE